MGEKKRFDKTRIFNLQNLIIFLVSLVVGILIFVFYCLCCEDQFTLYNSVNGLFVAAAILLFIGLGDITLNMGTFDIVAVGFANLYSAFKKDGKKRYDGVYEYQQKKEVKRKSTRFRFLSFLIAGIILLIISLILWGFWYKSINL